MGEKRKSSEAGSQSITVDASDQAQVTMHRKLVADLEAQRDCQSTQKQLERRRDVEGVKL